MLKPIKRQKLFPNDPIYFDDERLYTDHVKRKHYLNGKEVFPIERPQR